MRWPWPPRCAHIFFGEPGGVFFATSDIGWVVGHSYIVYGPLIAGMATILYEGAPTRPDPANLWRLVERHRVRAMFTAPDRPAAAEEGGSQPPDRL